MNDRFARHRLIPGWEQDRLTKATAVIIGVGAIGNEAARLLAMAGIGRLVLCDPDVVAESNLSRAVLFRAADIGEAKVDAAAQALADLAPATTVHTVARPHVEGVGLGLLRDADLILSCLDSLHARLALAARCNAVGAGLIDAGTGAWDGQVCYYRPKDACLGCGAGARQRARRDDPWSCGQAVSGQAVSGQPEAASAPVSALAGAWQAAIALRVLFELDVAAPLLLIGTSGELSRSALARNPDCPLHDHVDPALVHPIGPVASVADLLSFLEPGEEVFAWVNMPAGTPLIRSAPPDALLTELGVARREILPVARRSDGTVVRYLELGEDRP